jgi:hypothetical protein
MKWLSGDKGKNLKRGGGIMFKRKNRKKTLIKEFKEYYFINEERIFQYFEMTLMKQR